MGIIRFNLNSHRRFIVPLFCLTLLCSCATTDLPSNKATALEAYQNKEYDEATKQLSLLLEDVPQDADLWFLLGNSQIHSGEPKAAITSYENALLRNPDLTKAWFNMGVIYMQQALKAFVDMEKYSNTQNQVNQRGIVIREKLFHILQGTNEAADEAK